MRRAHRTPASPVQRGNPQEVPFAADGAANRAVAWSSFAIGALSGLVMGLWSFDGPAPVPAWIGAYGDASRRLLRLGHIAFFGLGMLNLLMARNLSAMPLAERTRRTALACMNFGNLALPPALIAAAAMPVFKYLLPLPAGGVTLALCLAAWGAWNEYRARPSGDTRALRRVAPEPDRVPEHGG